ncbi:hypothetical protein N7448_006425 [Penicillium atrosanguineum]|uniref:Allergen Asp f 4 n=1 Tax=Penicillium atrosanguineum TaxID=1132637 RepID=A0A9W9GYA7_9EURO|nr:hypothetical protein N7448_006425 [Penicillium atrosanguineum]KAJ5137522.1 hypothetical protein N7526_003755 [Penicillium atrosanguineum]KAJ5307756.1 hypothetical protein N7476_008412 [Penicillium atrosanguineum]
MHFKNTFLLASALTASTAVARRHGHERRHAHKAEIEEPQLPTVTDAPKIEDRAVGDIVTATIDGVLETWINEWSGQVAAESSSSSSSTIVVPTTTAAPIVEATATPANVESSVSATPVASSSSSGGSSWTTYPEDLSFSRDGFGGTNYKIEVLGIEWTGNTGIPWGSNIIEVDEADASKYQFVARFEGSENNDWTVIFWNKKGPNGLMDGFFNPNKALSMTLSPGEIKYVAFDEESTGGWAAFEGDDTPLSEYGSYAATWGEFTMRGRPNFASWDVSCIQAQNAGKSIQGMKICTHDGQGCSSMGNGASGVNNAYTSAETDINGIGGNVLVDALRLVVNLDYAE